MTRRKTEKRPAAQSKDEAITLLGRYAALQASIDGRRAQAEAAIAEIRAAVDGAIAPDAAELKAIFNQVERWWAVAGDELTEGKRKSLELGGCVLGERTTTPKLKLAGVTEAEAIESLREWSLEELLRIKTEIDKPACLKALADETPTGIRLGELGFQRSQKEEFFIAPIPPVAPAVEIVADDAAEQVLA